MLRAEAASEPGRYDLVHAHYWLSGKVGAAAKERWGVPLVQSMHTLGKVKNAALAAGDAAEPDERIRGELEVVAAADRLIANTAEEARQLTGAVRRGPGQGADRQPGRGPERLPAGRPAGARRRRAAGSGSRRTRWCCSSWAGCSRSRGPTCVLKAAARLLEIDPGLRGTLQVVIVGGPSGRAGTRRPGPDARTRRRSSGSATSSGSSRRARRTELAQWYRAATVMLAPSHSESFGLVALEAQACGTPVVAASVGGLRTVVRDGDSGVLVDGHDPADWARVIRRLVAGARPAAGTVGGRAPARVRFRLVRDRGPAGQGVYRCHGRGSSAGRSVTVMAGRPRFRLRRHPGCPGQPRPDL